MFAVVTKSLKVMGVMLLVATPVLADEIGGVGTFVGLKPQPQQPAQPGNGGTFMSEEQQFSMQQPQALQAAPNGMPTARVQVKTTVVGTLQYGLRIDGFVVPGGGLLVNKVHYNSPARKMVGPYGYIYALERGDMLEQINGQFISTPQDYLVAVNEAATDPTNWKKKVSLGIRDINDGQLKFYSAYLVRIK